MAFQRLLLVAVLLFTSDAGAHADSNTEKVATAVNNFGLKLYKELIKSHDNLFCSGYSFSIALNMLLVGAKGNTASEIRSALDYDQLGLTQTQIEDTVHNLLTEQRSNHTGYEFDIANSMWIYAGFSVLDDFKSTLVNKFYSEEKEVEFGTAGATDAINNWVNETTKGRIPKLFDEILDSFVRLVLVNAVFFKGTWVNKFNKDLTSEYPFTYKNDQNNTVESNIPMMNIVSKFPYAESNVLKSQIIEIPYAGNEVTMVIILPFEDNDLSLVEQKMTLNYLNFALSELDDVKVRLRIPKIKSSTSLNLNDVLKTMGIRDAFVHGQADLSGIDGTKRLFVSKTVQKAVIDVDEEGTVAAAASGIEASIRTISAQPKVFTADHPFVYLIRHKPTGIIYFMGRFSKP